MTETTTDGAALLTLLEPFPPEHVGKLPRVTCGDCSDKRKTCNKHTKKRCDMCSAWVSTQHIHLDYVGHADVTRRLLETDPAWSWDPAAEDGHGLPVLDTDDNGNPVGMWIKLTVLGVTRLGYGSCPSGQNDAVKVLIGDALRNAAMRFGVALDLWAKGDRADPSAENAVAAGGSADRQRRGSQAAPVSQPWPARTVETDWAWASAFENKVTASGSQTELAERWDELVAAFKDGKVTETDGNHLKALIAERKDELTIPRNMDGSTSRSRATDEQLAANGEMTKDQQAAHNALVRSGAPAPDQIEHLTGTPADDPWATGGEGA